MSEAEFLQKQADEAVAAMRFTARELFGDAGRAIDPRRWTQEFPWATLGVAAVAGFVVATDLLPRRQGSAQEPVDEAGRGESAGRHQSLITDVMAMASKVIALTKPVLDAVAAAELAHARAGQHNGQHPHSAPADAVEPGPIDV